MQLQKILTFFFLLATPALASQAQESEPEQHYKVELIVFEHRGGGGREDYYIQRDTKEPTERRSRKAPLRFQGVPASDYELSAIYQKLQRSNSYKPLTHAAWTQPGYAEGEAPSLGLSRVARMPANLRGNATLYRSRFLHLTLDLELGNRASPIKLQEKRKIKSGELHYFDHPRFGAIVKILPVEN